MAGHLSVWKAQRGAGGFLRHVAGLDDRVLKCLRRGLTRDSMEVFLPWMDGIGLAPDSGVSLQSQALSLSPETP